MGGPPFSLISDDVILGTDVVLVGFANLYGCKIGAGTMVGPFCEIQQGVVIGEHCKIQSHVFICEGVTIGDGVFIGHGVMFTNDRYPKAADARGRLVWEDGEPTVVEDGASIGSGAVVLPGLVIGRDAMVGAGSVVTRDVPAGATVYGVRAR